jgi:hypothetical protein
MSAKINLEFPKQFVEALGGQALLSKGLVIEIRCVHRDSGHPVKRRFYPTIDKLEHGWPELTTLNDSGYNIFFTVVPRNPKSDHKLPEPLVLPCLWADLDVGKDKAHQSVNDAMASLAKCDAKPTITVRSGHGVHSYWCFRKPVTIDATEARALLQALAHVVGGDPQSAEVARLLRMPNTANWKTDVAVPCEVDQLKPARRYKLSELRKVLPHHSKELKPKRKTPKVEVESFVEFYSKHVPSLRTTGETQAVGKCPFHDDQHPSWSLRTTDGVWHCFGCSKSGNAISFCFLLSIDPSDCPEGDSLSNRALAIEKGGYITWKKESDHWAKVAISNFVVEWVLENRVSDHIRLEDRVYDGVIVTESDERIPIRISNIDLCSNAAFQEILFREAGRRIWLNDRYLSQIRSASLLFSEAKMLVTSMDFGFRGSKTFLTPTLKITRHGIKKATETQVELQSVEHARHLDLVRIGSERLKKTVKQVVEDLLELQPHAVTFPLLGFLGATPLMHLFDDPTRYALWLLGPSGSGKSFLAKLFQCFFGQFATQGRVASWSSTTNSLQFMGYFFKDAIYLVDDYKPVMVSNAGYVVQFIQTYADLSGRSRLTSEIKSRRDYYIRGSLLTTGEDMPSGHASVLARSLIVPVEADQADTERGRRCLQVCKYYPGVTACYIRYLLQREHLGKRTQRRLADYHELFLRDVQREENSVRIARNLALNLIGFWRFTRFLAGVSRSFHVDKMVDEHFRILVKLRDRMFSLVRQEQPAQVFLQTLADGLASDKFLLQSSVVTVSVKGRTFVGADLSPDDEFVYIFPREAVALVRFEQTRLGRHFDWSPHALTRALVDCGALERQRHSNDMGTRIRLFGEMRRVWKIRKKSLGLAISKKTGHD